MVTNGDQDASRLEKLEEVQKEVSKYTRQGRMPKSMDFHDDEEGKRANRKELKEDE